MIERLIEFITPDCCIICNKEGICLCEECAQTNLVVKKPSCVLCNSLTPNGQTCNSCRSKTKLSGASVAYRYENVTKELITRLKYHHQRSIARFFGKLLVYPDKYSFDLVSFVPSDGRSRRARGYNQAELLAKSFAKQQNLPLQETLLRQKHIRQVGLNRKQRLEAIEGNFVAYGNIAGKNILLIDDVVTTGATLRECASVLKLAGAKRIWGVAVAKK